MSEQRIKVAITCGDPNGVGPETIIKVLHDPRMIENITPIVYAHPEVIKAYKKVLGPQEEFYFNTVQSASEAVAKKVNLVNVWKDGKIVVEPGKATREAGMFAFKCLEAAVNDIASNKVDVLVTAPINKDTIQSKEFPFAGHTEYLAKVAGTDQVLMFLVSERLRVGVVTGHVPLKDVAQHISREKIIAKLRLMRESLMKDFGIPSPRIAVLGLNPHAGDNGVIGQEEKEIILPAVREAVEAGWYVFGPYGADGFFGSNAFTRFDAVLAMYHDQGLAPFKALAFESGVNYTAGLPIVRTSPDHGTAYDLAGKGEASESSLRAAIFTACDIYRRKKEYREMTVNPLQKYELKDSREDVKE
ncbi:MAG: 4-hydroxythreonine-4-phosphate dehydrogenase PdxA [Flavobacteriales bacterium]|nr:4-hydroxythreonine-4-phosphate dehydrogenase PdxA [Flavobacteriales bacterium]